MAGTQYVALSALHSRLRQLDHIAGDIANSGTAGYKGQRLAMAESARPTFGDELQTAIDTATGTATTDFTQGEIVPTGRSLDCAIQGEGFFVLETPAGTRYTRNGHFSRGADGTLVVEEGVPVLGQDGPIELGRGELRIDGDGVVWSGTVKSGRLQVVTFDNPSALARDRGATLRNDAGLEPVDVDEPAVTSGALEGSNVKIAEKLAELTNVQRSFEALQKSIAMILNDVDGKSIEVLGRR